jgi:hypothetical protein
MITLAGIAFTAAIDLWRMRNRGRKLTITSMILILPIAILFALQSNEYEWDIKIASVGICIVSSASLLYLFLPKVRIVFTQKVDRA